MSKGRYVLVFVLTAALGVLVWSLENTFLSDAIGLEVRNNVLFDFFGLPLMVLVGAAAGFAVPRAFWLWGVAVVSLQPLATAVLVMYQEDRGVIGPSEVGNLALVWAILLVEFAVVCTAGSAAGAGLRLLLRRLLGGSRPTTNGS